MAGFSTSAPSSTKALGALLPNRQGPYRDPHEATSVQTGGRLTDWRELRGIHMTAKRAVGLVRDAGGILPPTVHLDSPGLTSPAQNGAAQR